MDLHGLQANQLDGLREVANIGAGHAATALSQLTGHRVTIEVPEVSIVPLAEVGSVLIDTDRAVTRRNIVRDVRTRTQSAEFAVCGQVAAPCIRALEPSVSPTEQRTPSHKFLGSQVGRLARP